MNSRAASDLGSAPVCIVNSLPKSGTHLLEKVVGLLPGMKPADSPLTAGPDAPDIDMGAAGDDTRGATDIPLGVGRPRAIPRERLSAILQSLPAGTFVKGHVPWSPAMAELLREYGIRMISIVRDPRDVAVSQARFVASTPGMALYGHYQSLSDDERIMTAITGIRAPAPGPRLRDIGERLDAVLRWGREAQNLLTFFERLVGPRGGGTREAQLREIAAIARHVGVPCSEGQLDAIAEHAFGGTATFRKGAIGSWREHFNVAHKQACKALVGERLIDLGYERDLEW